MQTLNYIGCKNTLYKTIESVCLENIEGGRDKCAKMSVVDIFAGTGVVGYNFQNLFGKVISNDLEYYSYVINSALLKCSYSDRLKRYIELLNGLVGCEGLIYKHFSPNGDCKRMFFTNENAKMADRIRKQLDLELKYGKISEAEFNFLLASLLVSIDKVANTTSVYGAYLKKFKPSAMKAFVLIPIHTKRDVKEVLNNVVCGRAEDFFDGIYSDGTGSGVKKVDVVYMDPPYNHRQYSGNYSQLNYIAKYDASEELVGVTGLMKEKNSSSFCSKGKVLVAFEEMV
jgi:adenine-specific DNA-methyltransferase